MGKDEFKVKCDGGGKLVDNSVDMTRWQQKLSRSCMKETKGTDEQPELSPLERPQEDEGQS